MQTQVTETGRFERTLRVHLDEAELEAAKDRAARELSKRLKIKGFRPGKAPRPIVERMVGSDALRQEAIEDALPELIDTALRDTELEPVTTPRVVDVRDADGGVDVDVLVTLWPTLDAVPEYAGRRIEVERPEVADEEVQAQLDALREQFAELEAVARPAQEGDFVLLNLTVLESGRELEELAANDLLYEIGSRAFLPGLDDLLLGASAGDIREGPSRLPEGFTEHGGEEVTLRVLVKEVRAKKLPELTDELVADVTEFATVDELVDRIRGDLLEVKKARERAGFEEKLVDALLADLDLELPEALVEAEVEARLRGLVGRLEQQGIGVGDYLRLTGQTEESVIEDARASARRALAGRVLLEAVARIEGLEVTDEEYRAAVESIAASAKADADELATALAESGRGEDLTGDILRRKALRRLAEAAVPVDADGQPVDLTLAVEADDEGDDEDDDAPERDGDTVPEAAADLDSEE